MSVIDGITVTVHAGNRAIYTRTATKGALLKTGIQVFNVDDGSVIPHDPKNGIAGLARAMLNGIREYEVEK